MSVDLPPEVAALADEYDLVPGALAQRLKDERNIARQQLRGAVDALRVARENVKAALDGEARGTILTAESVLREALDRLGGR